MGLDIYLRKDKNHAETKAKEAKYNEVSEHNWEQVGGYEKATEKQKEEVSEKNTKLSQSLGLGDHGYSSGEEIERASKHDPKHLFRVGYFRSSYNGGGFNTVVNNWGVPDLYYIFQPTDDYDFSPDWKEALVRVNEAIKTLKQRKKEGALHHVSDVTMDSIFGTDDKPTITSPADAVKAFMKQKESHKGRKGFDCYSNGDGLYSISEPLKIHAIIKGTRSFGGLGSSKTAYIVYAENEEDYQWYLNAYKIVKETIQLVLKSKHPEHYYLAWSG
jgi:hypothetical protein